MSNVRKNKVTYQSEFPVIVGESVYSYFEVSEAEASENYFSSIYKFNQSIEQKFSLVFQLDRAQERTMVRTSSFLVVMRNFGGLLATLYVIGNLVNKSKS